MGEIEVKSFKSMYLFKIYIQNHRAHQLNSMINLWVQPWNILNNLAGVPGPLCIQVTWITNQEPSPVATFTNMD